jgi:adenosylhomocysteine nucleosidase
MRRIALIAALPGELKPLVRGWTRLSNPGVDLWRTRRDGREWLAVCAGVGAGAAARAFAEAEKAGSVDLAVSLGWAGALSREFEAGRAYRISTVIDALTGERFPVAGQSGKGVLVTSDKIADRDEKRRLAKAFGAGLVDMEAATVARMAKVRGIPFSCIKGVSDGVDDQIFEFKGFITKQGEFRLAPFIVHAALRPWLWAGLAQMGNRSRKAAVDMTRAWAADPNADHDCLL